MLPYARKVGINLQGGDVGNSHDTKRKSSEKKKKKSLLRLFVGEAEVCPKTSRFLGVMGMLAWRIIPLFEFPFNFPVSLGLVS